MNALATLGTVNLSYVPRSINAVLRLRRSQNVLQGVGAAAVHPLHSGRYAQRLHSQTS